MRAFYTFNIEQVWEEQGLICYPAWAGLLLVHPDKDGVLYFSYETGEVRQVSEAEEEALTL